ncbi:MAG: hypothetical protein AAF547_03965 [Actinomycetota bacterium]
MELALPYRLADPEHGAVDDLIDVERHPLCGAEARRSAAEARARLDRDGAVRLPGFLRQTALTDIATDIAKRAVHAPIRRHRAGAYHRSAPLDDGASPLPELEWLAGHVTRDMLPCYTAAQRLYVSPTFKRWVADVVGLDRVYEYADPLAGLVATILPPGGAYPWHYDTNEFVLTIPLQTAERGGRFEYHRDLRTPGDENLDGLRRIVSGDGPPPRLVPASPGDLIVFRGRYSLHQVSRVEGTRSRHVLVLSYADRPDVIGPLDRTRSVYGRVTERHLLAAGTTSADGLIL